jgi:hypothetical protein
MFLPIIASHANPKLKFGFANYEVNLTSKKGIELRPVEIRTSVTWHDGFTKNICCFHQLINTNSTGGVVYGRGFQKKNPWMM